MLPSPLTATEIAARQTTAFVSGAALLVCALYCLRGLLQTVFGSSGLPCCSKGQIVPAEDSDTGSESDED